MLHPGTCCEGYTEMYRQTFAAWRLPQDGPRRARDVRVSPVPCCRLTVFSEGLAGEPTKDITYAEPIDPADVLFIFNCALPFSSGLPFIALASLQLCPGTWLFQPNQDAVCLPSSQGTHGGRGVARQQRCRAADKWLPHRPA